MIKILGALLILTFGITSASSGKDWTEEANGDEAERLYEYSYVDGVDLAASRLELKKQVEEALPLITKTDCFTKNIEEKKVMIEWIVRYESGLDEIPVNVEIDLEEGTYRLLQSDPAEQPDVRFSHYGSNFVLGISNTMCATFKYDGETADRKMVVIHSNLKK